MKNQKIEAVIQTPHFVVFEDETETFYFIPATFEDIRQDIEAFTGEKFTGKTERFCDATLRNFIENHCEGLIFKYEPYCVMQGKLPTAMNYKEYFEEVIDGILQIVDREAVFAN